jgi:hypothetical protein
MHQGSPNVSLVFHSVSVSLPCAPLPGVAIEVGACSGGLKRRLETQANVYLVEFSQELVNVQDLL